MKPPSSRRFRRLLELVELYPDRWSDLTLRIALARPLPASRRAAIRFLDETERVVRRLTNGNCGKGRK